MQKGQNYNRPQKGSQIKVEPIRKKRDISSIKKMLSGNPRDLALFTLGINTNLRASDLLRITAGQVKDLTVEDSIVLKEKKTGKHRMVTLNRACVQVIQDLLQDYEYEDNEPLFRSQRGTLTCPQ